MGLKRLFKNSTDYIWLDGIAFESSDFQNIVQFDDEFARSDEACICFEKRKEEIYAKKLDCDEPSHYLCQNRGTVNYCNR